MYEENQKPIHEIRSETFQYLEYFLQEKKIAIVKYPQSRIYRVFVPFFGWSGYSEHNWSFLNMTVDLSFPPPEGFQERMCWR